MQENEKKFRRCDDDNDELVCSCTDESQCHFKPQVKPPLGAEGETENRIKDHRIKELTEQCEKYRAFIFDGKVTTPLQDTGKGLEECKDEVANRYNGFPGVPYVDWSDMKNTLTVRGDSNNIKTLLNRMDEAAELYASQRQTEWVSVETPPSVASVLIAYKFGVAEAKYQKELNTYWDTKFSFEFPDVTHYQYLPTPPTK